MSNLELSNSERGLCTMWLARWEDGGLGLEDAAGYRWIGRWVGRLVDLG